MKKFTLIFFALTQIAVANSPDLTQAAKKQCERCGKAIALRQYLKNLEPNSETLKKEVPVQINGLDEYIDTTCKLSLQELTCALETCENNGLHVLYKYYLNLPSGVTLHPTSNASNAANSWLRASIDLAKSIECFKRFHAKAQ